MYNVSDAYKVAIASQSRQFRLDGLIKLQSGVTIEINDRNVKDELSISTQMMSGSEHDTNIDIGAICAAVLCMTVMVDAERKDADFGNAFVRLAVELLLPDSSYESVRMGVFYIAPDSINRARNQISFVAYDKMTLLDFLLTDAMREAMNGMTPYEAAAYLCGLVHIPMAQTAAAVAAFPNADMQLDFSSTAMETARDVIMWGGQLLGSFSRLNRTGQFEFVLIKAENDPDTHMIIPVREIAARQRFKTLFSDSVIRISTLTMKKYDGKYAKANISYTSENKRSLELELEQNPLLLTQEAKSAEAVLADILGVVSTAYFRPFNCVIANDPALDAGDYVRLRGGAVDTTRGYATGIITHNTWRYRGKQDIVNIGAATVIDQIWETETAETAESEITEIYATSSNSESGTASEDITYTQPRSQSSKLTKGGDTFNNPIILTQKDLGYILHTYHVVEYLKGMAVLAQGPDTTIIVNGYLAISTTSSGTDWGNHKGYGKIEIYGNRNKAIDTSPEKIVIRSEISKASPTSVTVAIYDNDDKDTSITTFGGEWRFILIYHEISAPSEYFPNGSATCSIKFVYYNAGGGTELYTVNTTLLQVAFSGISEYNAAIRLYKEPYYGSDVTETTIVDDGSSTLEKAMQYTDRVTADLKTSIDNITDADRQQITQNTEDIAAIDKRVATAEGTISDITDPTSGIFAKSKEYTDAAIDSITTS